MKKLFPILLLIAFITCLVKISKGQELYLVPKELIDMAIESKVGPGLIQLKAINKTVDTVIYADGNHYYLISSFDGNNAPGTKIRIQMKQVAMNEVPVDTIPDPLPVIIDTVDAEAAIFSTGWTRSRSTTAKWYGGTMAWSNIKDATITYKDPLPYRRIEIYSERKNTHGSIQLTIDGGSPVTWDLYNPVYEIPYLVWVYDDLPLGIHEVKIRVTGEKRAESSNTYGLLDFFRIIR